LNTSRSSFKTRTAKSINTRRSFIRWLFNNANSGWLLPPKPSCEPVVTGGPVVDAIWRRLLDRSGPRAGVPLTDEPDLHLLADGYRLDAVWCGNGVYEFSLRSVPNMVRIMSRAAIPQEFGHVRDARPLGVALLRVAIWQGAQVRTIESDDPMLRDGFHRFERSNGFRWTCGGVVLPRCRLQWPPADLPDHSEHHQLS
jgi:hypothetical protein